jgi:hypothetical protein
MIFDVLEQVVDKVADHVHDVWVALHADIVSKLDHHAAVLWFDVLEQVVDKVSVNDF